MFLGPFRTCFSAPCPYRRPPHAVCRALLSLSVRCCVLSGACNPVLWPTTHVPTHVYRPRRRTRCSWRARPRTTSASATCSSRSLRACWWHVETCRARPLAVKAASGSRVNRVTPRRRSAAGDNCDARKPLGTSYWKEEEYYMYYSTRGDRHVGRWGDNQGLFSRIRL